MYYGGLTGLCIAFRVEGDIVDFLALNTRLDAILGVMLFLGLFTATAEAQTAGEQRPGSSGVTQTTEQIMERQPAGPAPRIRPEHELEDPDRSNLPQYPNAPDVSRSPPPP